MNNTINFKTLFGSFFRRPELKLKTGFRCEVSALKLGQTSGDAYLKCKIANRGNSAVIIENFFLKISHGKKVPEAGLHALPHAPAVLQQHGHLSVEYNVFHLCEAILNPLSENVRIKFSVLLSDKRVYESEDISKQELDNYVSLVQQQFSAA